MRSKNSFLYKF